MGLFLQPQINEHFCIYNQNFVTQPTCTKGIEVCCDQKCMHKYVLQKNITWKHERLDE
jgi:hypothetical protein